MIHPVVINLVRMPIVDVLNPVGWRAGSSYPAAPEHPDLPANAIYANGEAIPDPSGGYLRYGDTVA